jgi:ABC-2 type transport system permease protein
MDVIWSICRRDCIAAFTTPLAWLLLASWTMLTNGMFVYTLYSVHGKAGSASPLFVDALELGVFFLSLLAPAVTMTSFAAERVQGTMQLLLTAPIREHQLVLGKFLASFLVLASLVAATLVQPLILLFISQVHPGQLGAGYLGLLLECAFFAALGCWISLLVDSPVAAYVLSFGAICVLMLIGLAGADGPLHPLAEALGLGSRVGPFFHGDVRLGNIVYFLGGTAGCLVLAHGALCSRRIHG